MEKKHCKEVDTNLILLILIFSCFEFLQFSEVKGNVEYSNMDVAYWIGSNPSGYWQDPANWENYQIPTLNQTVMIKHSKLRILPDLETIKINRIIIESLNYSNENLLIMENPIQILNGIEIGEFSKVIFNENVACLEGFHCKLNIRGKVEVFNGKIGFWNEKWNDFRMETFLKNENASFKISNRKFIWNETKLEEGSDFFDNDFGKPFAKHEILLFVPSTRNVNCEISNEEIETLLERIISDISKIVGGVTLYPNQKGFWLSETEGLVRETVNIISVSVPDESFAETRRKIKKIALELLEELNQEAIFVKIDSNSYLITKQD